MLYKRIKKATIVIAFIVASLHLVHAVLDMTPYLVDVLA
jgi:hypothetical protein